MRNLLLDLVRKNFPAWGTRTQIFGIVNVTPDSFNDGGRFLEPSKAYARVLELVRDGADAIDFGAESTRPGAEAVSPQQQWARLGPILDGLKEKLAGAGFSPAFSIDTRHPAIAEKAFQCGFTIVNDVSGGLKNPELQEWVAKREVLYILMHMRGEPRSMAALTDYGTDFMGTLQSEIAERIEQALARGIKRNQIILDPGIGFAKTPEQNWEMLARLDELNKFGFPIFIGPSRKSFLRFASEGFTDTDRSLDRKTLVAITCGVLKGARLVRIHEVNELLPGIRLADQFAGHGKQC